MTNYSNRTSYIGVFQNSKRIKGNKKEDSEVYQKNNKKGDQEKNKEGGQEEVKRELER